MRGGRSSRTLFKIELFVGGIIAIVAGRYIGGYYGGIISGLGIALCVLAVYPS